MSETRRTSRTLVCGLLAAITFAPRAQADAERIKDATAYLLALDTHCGAAEKALLNALSGEKLAPQATWDASCDAKTAEEDIAACRQALISSAATVVDGLLAEEIKNARKAILERLATDDDAFRPDRFYLAWEEAMKGERADVRARVEEAATEVVGDLEPGKSVLAVLQSQLGEAVKRVLGEFGATCRSAHATVASQIPDLARSTRDEAERALIATLRKTDGFSRLVRCQWVAPDDAIRIARLECSPGLLLGAQDASTILVEGPPSDAGFALRRVVVTTAEEEDHQHESAHQRAERSCPGFDSTDPRKLTCDEMCFQGAGNGCGEEVGFIARATVAEVAVHKARRFHTSYGCRRSDLECATRALRSGGKREKLSLLLEGKSPHILVRAEAVDGSTAYGTVLVGYERWRFETGGFLALTNVVDEELITEATDDGKVRVVAIRDADNYAQDTGIFLNLIPRNYENVGFGLGFAAAESRAPAVYFGGTIRLRSFGNRGLASVIFGNTIRSVERFEDAREGQSYAPDSVRLQPRQRFEVGFYVGIQLGFAFGPISNGSGGAD